MRLYKCVHCKKLIAPDELTERNGKRYHKSCRQTIDRDNVQWDGLYQYLLRVYFVNDLPPRLIGDLKRYRAYYTFAQMLDCFCSLESQLSYAVAGKSFESTAQKGAYLFAALRNHIEIFIEKQVFPQPPKSSTSLSYSTPNETVFSYQLSHFKKFLDQS